METKKTNLLPLSIQTDTFNAFKTDFDSVLRALIGMMIAKGSEDAKINVVMKISLAKDTAPDAQITEYDAQRDVVLPKFDHKITSQINIKDVRDGFLGGENYELVFDEATGYALRPVKDMDNKLFDPDDMDSMGDEPEEDYTCPQRADLSCDIAIECGKCCADCEKVDVCANVCDRVNDK